MRGWILVGVLVVSGCSQESHETRASDDASLAAADAVAAAEAAQEAMVRSPVTTALDPQPSPYTSADWRSFDTPCTDDCSGHDAGYQWAEAHDIETPDDCSGNSQSFIEGCEQYAQELQQQMVDDGECEDADEDGLCD